MSRDKLLVDRYVGLVGMLAEYKYFGRKFSVFVGCGGTIEAISGMV